MKQGWMRRRWWEFRTGHSTYLIFILTFVNFILISYRLLIEKITFFQELIPNLYTFVALFLAFYIPSAIIIGNWHRKTQLRVESTIQMNQNPVFAKMIRTLLDVQTGKSSENEIREFREFLKKIESKMDH